MGRTMKTDYSYEGDPASMEQMDKRIEELEKNPPGGTSDYEKLQNLPQINGETIKGSKEAKDYDLVDKKDSISQSRIDEICQ